jgi:hypothetical protein
MVEEIPARSVLGHEAPTIWICTFCTQHWR